MLSVTGPASRAVVESSHVLRHATLQVAIAERRIGHWICDSGVLLGLENDPPGIATQLTKHPLERYCAISRHREHALQNGIEKTPILREHLLADRRTHIFRVQMRDAFAVTLGQGDGVCAREARMPGVE